MVCRIPFYHDQHGLVKMRASAAFVLLILSLLACSRDLPPEHQGSAETLPAFGVASGVARADSGSADRQFRVVALRSMAGDVEVLYGDPEKPGEPFVMRIRELPGTIIPLHFHQVDEHLTVVQGTFYFGVGEEWDRTVLKELKTGAYAFAPRGSRMFGYSPDGAVVQVHGVGPFHIHWVNGAKTLDDADAGGTFRFQKGERVQSTRGTGTIRQGYASGAIVQYEVEPDDGSSRFMASEEDLRRI